MTKIFYITRSFFPYDAGGGALMRNWAVEYLTDLGWEVIVIRPEYEDTEILIKQNVISIPFKTKYRQKWFSALERVGWYEDYLDPWVRSAFHFLKNTVNKEDIIFSTSGGELGTIKLGALIKAELGCRLVVNFRDPLNYGYMGGLRRDNKPHVGRVDIQRKYLNNVDLILTSSRRYCEILRLGFPELEDKLRNNYFGYGKLPNRNNIKKQKARKVTIAYTGNLSKTQKPEFILDVVRNQNFYNLKIVFIGNIANYNCDLSGVQCEVEFIETMQHDHYQKYMQENVDIGVVSLASDYYGACVPSKIYEYISLGLPMLGFLPPGDAESIINDNKFGVATRWGDIENAQLSIKKILNDQYQEEFRANLFNERHKWSMKARIKDVDEELRKL